MSEQREKLTEEQIHERIAVAAKRRAAREAERAERKQKRREIRRRLASVKDIAYFHFRAEPGRQPGPKGGICVAVLRTPCRIVLAASVCSRLDTYDRLEARRYAFDRVMNVGEFGEPLRRLVLQTAYPGDIRYEHAVYDLAVFTAKNAVAYLRKKADRKWMERHVLRWMGDLIG